MQWLELTIECAPAGLDPAAARLTALGYDSFIIDDEAGFQEFLEENRKYWDYVDEALEQKMHGLCCIRLYLEDAPAAADTVRALRAELAALSRDVPGAGEYKLSVQSQRDEDWENNWKQYYKPILIGEKLAAVPEWLVSEAPAGRIPVILDPGLTFGTGAHASTAMCMAALERTVRGGEQAVDLGSGSGILSITALRLGAARAVGVDIDEIAEGVARENAACNGLGPDRFTAMTGNVLDDPAPIRALCPEGFDLVLANIVADVIIPLAPCVRALARPGAAFICSGILEQRLPEVRAALQAAGLAIGRETVSPDSWCCVEAAI